MCFNEFDIFVLNYMLLYSSLHRVINVKGLRVADASIQPIIPNANTAGKSDMYIHLVGYEDMLISIFILTHYVFCPR